MRYFWTIQSNKVVEIINNDMCYYPDIKYLKGNYESAYKIVLNSFNKINESNYNGLVFGFAKKGENNYFGNIDELYAYFLQNPLVTKAFNLWNNQYVILQLRYTEEFNMIPIDFNDFIQIMPPVWDKTAYNKIITCIKSGVNTNGYTLPSFTQIHAPFIKREHIINIYNNFDKNNSDHNKELIVFPRD